MRDPPAHRYRHEICAASAERSEKWADFVEVVGRKQQLFLPNDESDANWFGELSFASRRGGYVAALLMRWPPNWRIGALALQVFGGSGRWRRAEIHPWRRWGHAGAAWSSRGCASGGWDMLLQIELVEQLRRGLLSAHHRKILQSPHS